MGYHSIFSEFFNAKVTLKKQNGEEYTDIPASVQSKKIFIDDVSIPIEEGDHLVRKLPNGLEEYYLVLDRGYFDQIQDIEAHYQVSVQKESTRKLNNSSTNNYNINGTNERIVINSTDNSLNIKNINKNLFDRLRNIVNENVQDESEIIGAINNMEDNIGKPSFKDSYNNFIQSAANHMALLAPFIPLLTDLLTKR
jgi:nitrogenase molybdenum-iron protein alpha/beta subunit